VIRSVPRSDLGQPVDDIEVLTIRTGGHVTEDQRIGSRRVFDRELLGELAAQPTFIRFQQRARMIGDEAGDAGIESDRPEPTCTVQRMEPGDRQGRCVPDVMQPRSRDQHRTVLGIQARSNSLGLRCDSLDVRPTPG
jgi:hypothetical protein